MDALIILGCLGLVPPIVTLLLRSNGVLVFLSVCLGSVLSTYLADDVGMVISGASRSSALNTMQWSQLGLLVLPVVLTIVLARKKLKGVKLLLGAIAAAAGGGLLALLAVPFLSRTLQDTIRKTDLWHQLDNAQSALLIVGVIVTLLLLFMTRTKPVEDKGKKHKK